MYSAYPGFLIGGRGGVKQSKLEFYIGYLILGSYYYIP